MENLEAEDLHRQIAEAVHKAIILMLEVDGTGQCFLYTTVGMLLAKVVTGKPYHFCAGDIQVEVDELGSNFEFSATKDGVENGAFHCWFESPDGNEIIDLSARHYPTLAKWLVGTWEREDVPDFIWSTQGGLPPGVKFTYDAHATEVLLAQLENDPVMQERITTVCQAAQLILTGWQVQSGADGVLFINPEKAKATLKENQ
jgi:hypothetical protein